MTVSTLLAMLEGKPCLRVTPEATVKDAATLMKRSNCGAVVVIQQGELIGIFTERDLVTRVVAENLDPSRVTMKAVMSSDPFVVQVSEGLSGALNIMCKNGLRHIPVLKGHKLLGVLSIRHVYEEICSMFEQKINEQDAIISYAFGTAYGCVDRGSDKKTFVA